MFEQLTSKFDKIFRSLSTRGKISPKDIKETGREIRRALLEADVHYKVVKNFIADIEEEAVGEKVIRSVTPGQMVVKIVHERLVKLLGGKVARLELPSRHPTIVMMVGLQGSGKTTSAVKLALRLKDEGWQPAVVGADIYRPAAGEQLRQLADATGIPAVIFKQGEKPQKVLTRARAEARKNGWSVLIVDTAGRLQIDARMMMELQEMKMLGKPDAILLVADAMTGQEAVNIGTEFDRQIGVDGFILAKMDGDARGGAALSLRAVTGKPIYYIGTGEKPDGFEPFYPDRQANRILGMGDVVTLVERAEKAVDEEKAKEMERKLRKAQFTLTDFLDQLQQLKKMGSLEEILSMVPGMNMKKMPWMNMGDDAIKKTEAIIYSMTPREREHPEIIDGKRRKRIARGSGSRIQDVNRLLKQFDTMRQMFKRMKKGKGLPFFG